MSAQPPDFDHLPKMAGESDPERIAAVTKRIKAAASTDNLSPRRQTLKDLADATRELTNRLVATDAPDEVIAAATVDLRAALSHLDGYKQGSLYGFSEMATTGTREDPLFDHSPLIGIANPLAPPMSIREEDGTIIAEVTFPQAYEGPPGCVHGGYVAAIFDELLGATQSLSGAPGMTGTLSVRYESPTPLKTPLRLVGKISGVERRKIFTEGSCFAGDRLTATAKGIFISIRPGQFLDLLAEREARSGEVR